MVKIIDEKKLFKIAFDLIKRSCVGIAPDAMQLLKNAYAKERNLTAKSILETMIRNSELATTEGKPVCQSPGYPVVYATLGAGLKLDVGIQTVFQKALVKAPGNCRLPHI